MMPWMEAFRDPRYWAAVVTQLVVVGGGAYGFGVLIGMGCH